MPESFWVYDLTNRDAAGRETPLCLGERVKKGTYRGTIETCIPYSQISGALWARFNAPFDAVGIFISRPCVVDYAFALQDAARGVAKLTLQVSALTQVRARVYIAGNDTASTLREEFELTMGALRSKGFGKCWLEKKRAAHTSELEMKIGELRTRIPERALDRFGVYPIRELWGYLFEPDAMRLGGRYTRALLEKSLVRAPRFLVKETPFEYSIEEARV